MGEAENADDTDTHLPSWLWRRRPMRLLDLDYADPDCVFFVTIRARAGTRPFTNARLADEVFASLNWLRANRGVRIYAYCLMLDHLHLLLRLEDTGRTLGDVMGAFKSFTTRQSWKLGHNGQLWQERYYDHVLRRSEDGQGVVKYILENPVRNGLVQEPDDYPYSGTPDAM